MHRTALTELKQWLSSANRKPLVLRGARQVGKTWLVRKLAKKTGSKLVELNFEKDRSLAQLFESNDPLRILLNLKSALNCSISPENSILFLDEIQAAPELLAKLRWFYEMMPELPIVAAGSLLEFTLKNHSFSMPVGRINYFFLEPLGFEEFLLAKDEKHLLSAIQAWSFKEDWNEALHQKASQLFKEYSIVGGMPEAVSTWVKTQSPTELASIQNNLIQTYKDDFPKYTGKLSIDYLEKVLGALPRMLTRKFIHSQVDPSARHASIKQAVDLLIKSRLCHPVKGAYANGIPLGAELNPKLFKLICIDVGLVSTMLDLKLHQFQTLDDLTLINKGALAEQVVGQLLRLLVPSYVDPALYYWAREAPSSSAEIDYVIQENQMLIPIEVKSGSEGKLRGLHQFMFEKPWERALRFYSGMPNKTQVNTKTTQGHAVNYELLSLPFYFIQQLNRLLN